jgi:hypothetical protein
MKCACIALVLITSFSPSAIASGQGKSGDQGKKADKSAVDSILKAIATSPIINAYKTAVTLAEQNFNTSITAANLALKTALAALIPAPSPSPSST